VILSMIQMFGPICVDPEDGGRLCSEIHELLDSGDSVCLDFCGVSTVTSSFLNAAIGCLYASYQPDELTARLNCTGLDQTDEAILRLVQSNAIRYFTAPPATRERLEAVNASGKV
jgi:hypothetical protein